MSNLNWNQVKADFHDANQSMATSSGAISQAGTIFGQLRKSILDEEQRAVDNAYREKLFNENVRQFGLEHALKEDQFREGVRQFGLTHQLDKDKLQEEILHHRNTEKNQSRATNIAEAEFNLKKQQLDFARKDSETFGKLMTGALEKEDNDAYRKVHAEDYKIIEDYDKGQAEVQQTVNANLLNNEKQQEALKAEMSASAAKQQEQENNFVKNLFDKYPHIDKQVEHAQEQVKSLESKLSDAKMFFGTPLGGSESPDKLAKDLEVWKAQLGQLQGIQQVMRDGPRQITPVVNPDLQRRWEQLQQEHTNLSNYKPTLNPEIEQLRSNLEANRPKGYRDVITNPLLLAGWVAQNAPSQLPQMFDLLKTDMTTQAKSAENLAKREWDKSMAKYKSDLRKSEELSKSRANILTEIGKLDLQNNYEPYFTTVVQNALLYADEKGVSIPASELVNIVRQALEVQEETIGSKKETNSGTWQRIFGGAGTLEKQAATKFTDNMKDEQLQKIVDYIMRKKLHTDYMANKNKNK